MLIETPLVRPDYSSRFRCIGPACEDSCCTGWSVVFDQGACHKYERVPAGPLRTLLDASVIRQPLEADGSVPAQFARVRMTADHACPFLNSEKLCQIQAERGESELSVGCATYPRVAFKLDGLEEKALSLSCPEAARLVLLSPNLGGDSEQRYTMRWEANGEDSQNLGVRPSPVPLTTYFWPVREFVVGLLKNRDYALWQRLFFIGVFVRQLDMLARGELGRSFAAMLGGFRAAVGPQTGSVKEAGGLALQMNAIQPDLTLQLDVVLRLAGMPLARTYVGPRFVEVVGMFTRGVGNGPDATMELLVANYAAAYKLYFAPFFSAHPQMLENLLVNSVFRTLFPYGPKMIDADWEPAMERQFCLLAAQFALIKGLLIGVAGFRREAFAVEDVFLTVQAASKHFEHHPGFLDQTHALLAASHLNDLRGMTMLLRN